MQLAEISAFQQFAEPMELFLHRARTITGLLFLLALLSSCSGIERRDAALPSPQSTASAPENFLSDSTSIWTDSIQREEFCPVQSHVSKEREMAEEGWTVPESEATLDQEIAELEKLGSWEEGPAASEPSADQEKKTFPITINRQVEFYLDFFRNRHPQSFTRWLCRSGRYLPFIREQLQTAGLPEELAYLPLIESGFNLTAYSRARAVGPWQFMKGTGLQYGLTINSYVDERRDIVASTKAAIDLLKDLYDEFGSWNLAVAGYNAGPGTIRKAIRNSDTDNFWKLAQSTILRPETKLYVPKLIAAILIARNPESYGFTDIDYEEPLSYEEIEVPPWTALPAVAVAADVDGEEMALLNRELLRGMTPPDEPYTLKVPVGKGQLVADNLERVRAIVRTTYQNHTVRGGETIKKICRQFDLNTITLLKANNLKKSKLIAGQRLRIPVQTTEYKLIPKNMPGNVFVAQNDGMVQHVIRRGETLSTIARKYGVSTEQLASWNGIKDCHHIRAGSRLVLFLENPIMDDGVRSAALLTEAGKAKPIVKEQKAHQRAPASTSTYYNVQRGDSLWRIARKYRLTTEQIRRWNNLEDDTIKPGNLLLIRLGEDEDA